ncbi:MAG: nucleotidyltransferase family protein [Candidatus Omnitrophica bacterium]|nr:nucleotidyltransferase family protein [Candidatus Omnitrophota bacterium]
MKALILAAGYATRLYPLTRKYPKPLLKIGEKPIIDYIIEKLSAAEDIDEIIVVTNSKFISLFTKWASRFESIPKGISLVDDLTKEEADKRGAIGDMDFVIDQRRIKDDLLVIGGDNLFEDDLSKFLSFAKGKSPSPVIGMYDLKSREQASKYGVLKIDKDGGVIDFQEKPKNPESALIAMCLYYFAKEKLGLIKEYLNERSSKGDAMGFYIDWLRKKEKVYGFVFSGRWYDIGDHKFYEEANRTFTRRGYGSA